MHAPSHTATFAVTGMSCGHCERAIQGELDELPQLTVTRLSADPGLLEVSSDRPVPTELVIAAVAEAGYEATLTSSSES